MGEENVVVTLDVPWRVDPGASAPVVLHGGSSTVIVANASVSAGHEGESVVLSFEGCVVSRFGYSNDEALPGHPLSKRGLGYYGIYEVLNSSWILELQRQNRDAFPNTDWPAGPPVHHFVATFHDDTFECIALRLDGRFSAEPRSDLLAAAARRLT